MAITKKKAAKAAETRAEEVEVTFDSCLKSIESMSKTLNGALKAMEKSEKALAKLVK